MPRRKPTNPETVTTSTTSTSSTESATKVSRKAATPVSTAELISTVQSMQGQPYDQVCLATGHYFIETHPDGTVKNVVTKANMDALRDAIMGAQGFSFAPPTQSPTRRRNSKPIIKVGKNGNAIIGSRYMEAAGFPYGEDVETRLLVTAEAGRVTLTLAPPAGADSDADGGDADEDDTNGEDMD